MSALDIFVILLLGGGAVIGFVRGLVYELLSVLAWVAAIAVLKLFHTPVHAALIPPVGTDTGAAVLAFAILFLPTFLFVKLLAITIGRGTRRSVLGPVDRVLGAGFGMLKGLLVATLIYLVANLFTDLTYGPDAERPDWMRKSSSYTLLNASSRAIVDWVEARRQPAADANGEQE